MYKNYRFVHHINPLIKKTGLYYNNKYWQFAVMMSLSSIPVLFFLQAYGALFNKNPYFDRRVNKYLLFKMEERMAKKAAYNLMVVSYDDMNVNLI